MVDRTRRIVFTGPSLPAAMLPAHVRGLEVRPPARQGDIWRAVQHGAAVIGLIDGLFLDVPAVWHREILAALERGVRVIGGASMGALRAAELAPFGMDPVGVIAEAFISGRYPGFDEPFEDDDEVAVVHAPAAAGGAALGDAMVDLRTTLLRAEEAGIIDRAARDALALRMKRLHFSERSFARLVDAAHELCGEAVAAWIRTNRVSQKRLDALELVEAVAAMPVQASPEASGFRMEKALVWQRFIESEAQMPARELVLEERAALDRLAQDERAFERTRDVAVSRILALAGSGGEGDAKAALDRFRHARGLLMRRDLDRWLADNALGADELERLLNEEAALHSIRERLPQALIEAAMLDILRLEGRYAALAAGATRQGEAA